MQWTTELIEILAKLACYLFYSTVEYCSKRTQHWGFNKVSNKQRRMIQNAQACSNCENKSKDAENKSQDLSGSNCSTFQRIFNKDSYFQWFRILQVVVNIDSKIKSEMTRNNFEANSKLSNQWFWITRPFAKTKQKKQRIAVYNSLLWILEKRIDTNEHEERKELYKITRLRNPK